MPQNKKERAFRAQHVAHLTLRCLHQELDKTIAELHTLQGSGVAGFSRTVQHYITQLNHLRADVIRVSNAVANAAISGNDTDSLGEV